MNHRASSKFRQIVDANDRIIVVTPHIIYSRFEFDEILDVRLTIRCPVHVANDATERKSSLGIAAGQLLERFQHSILIETAISKVGFGIGQKLELAALLSGCRVDSRRY